MCHLLSATLCRPSDTMFANKTSAQSLIAGQLSGTVADPSFEYQHRGNHPKDEPTLARLDPHQHPPTYPQHHQHNQPPHHIPVYLSPSLAALQRPTITTATSNSSLHQQQHGQQVASSGRLDLRNLLLAPPAGPRVLRDGRGSVSAPATPVDDSSSLAVAAATVATAAVPLTLHGVGSNSGGRSSSTSSSGIGKFMMKKVNSSGGSVTGPPDCVLRDLIHPAHADALKAHSALAIKLLKTGKLMLYSFSSPPFSSRLIDALPTDLVLVNVVITSKFTRRVGR